MDNAVIDPNIPNIKWQVPFNEDAEPIGWAYYIYIKNSKSINTKSIKKFINERYFDYEEFFCINKIDGHFFLKFGKKCKKFSEQVYERLSNKQRFIDNICIEFDKPIKVFTFKFEDYEIPSPTQSPTESKTFDFPSTTLVATASDLPSAVASAVSYLPAASDLPSVAASAVSYLPAASDLPSAAASAVSYLPSTAASDLATVEENRIGYVFIDHSNIIYGAKDEGFNITSNMINEVIETNSPWICRRYLVGSGMFPAIVKSWEHMNYVVDNSPKGREYDVDAILHSKIINTIQTVTYPERSKLILATGDGNCHRDACSFPIIIEMALSKGWAVELYSWRISLSKQFLKINNPGFKIYILNELEPFKSQTHILSNRQKLTLVENHTSDVPSGKQRDDVSRDGASRNGASRNGSKLDITSRKIIRGIDISSTHPAELARLLGVGDFPPLK
jgi:hypothetical protein